MQTSLNISRVEIITPAGPLPMTIQREHKPASNITIEIGNVTLYATMTGGRNPAADAEPAWHAIRKGWPKLAGADARTALNRELVEVMNTVAGLNEQTPGDRHEPRCPAGCGCPSCGETRLDALIWQADDETVKCDTCGHSYTPDPARKPDHTDRPSGYLVNTFDANSAALKAGN